MKPRILLSALLALALSLTACTPAASETTGEAPAPATPEEATAETSAAFPVGHLRMIQYYESTADEIYNPVHFWNDAGEMQLQLLATDLNSGQRTSLYFGVCPSQTGVQVLPWRGQLCLFAGDTLYKMPPEGGTPQAIPLAEKISPDYADEYAAYEFDYRTDAGRNSGKRLDLETGQITYLELPGQIEGISQTGSPRLMLSRVITEAALPSAEDWDMYDALRQNGEREYDWYDPATGALEKVLTEPYNGVELPDGTRCRHDFIGRAGERLYFSRYSEDGSANGVESCALDGSDRQSLPGRMAEERPAWVFYQDGALRWMMGGEPGDLWIYDLSAEQTYELPHITVANGWPEALVGQDQVLVSQGREPGIVDGYALISRQDFLAGSTDWTPIVDAPTDASD